MVLLSAVTLKAAAGAVIANAILRVPDAIRGKKRRFSSSEPLRAMQSASMPVRRKSG